MNRPKIVLIVAFGLLLNAIYHFYNVIQMPYTGTFAWGVVSLLGAYGIFGLKKWSQYFIVFTAVFTISGWVDSTLQTYRNGWPYTDTASTIASFVPAFFLFAWWIAVSIYVIRLFSKQESKPETY